MILINQDLEFSSHRAAPERPHMQKTLLAISVAALTLTAGMSAMNAAIPPVTDRKVSSVTQRPWARA